MQHVYCIPYCTLNTSTTPFSGLAPLQLRMTYQTKQCNRMCFRRSTCRKSWQYSCCWKALQSMKLTRLRS